MNIINASYIQEKLKHIRYIIDESFGSTNNEFNTSWIEIQVNDVSGKNIALHKTVTANFSPMLDVTGQSQLSTITNGQITQREWVSCNISLLKKLPAKVIVDLHDYVDINSLKEICIYHGWWTERSYKNRIYLAESLHKPICVYDYYKDGPIYESIGKPLIIKLQ